MLSVTLLSDVIMIVVFCCYEECHYDECRYAGCRILIVMLTLIMLSFMMLSVYRLSYIILSVCWVPLCQYAECQFAKCIMLNASMLSTIMLSVMLCVFAPEGVFVIVNHFNPSSGNTKLRGRLSTVDLLVLTSLVQHLFILKVLRTFYKTTYLNEEVNCTEPPPSVSIPCLVTRVDIWLCL